MFINEKEYSKPQFEVVVIVPVDIINSSDNEVDISDFFSQV